MVILEHVKTIIGVSDDSFDEELLMHINASVTELVELGVTELADVKVETETEWPPIASWNLEAQIQTYVAIKTKSIFEPTSSSTISQAYTRYLLKLEGLIQILAREEEV